MITTYYLKSKQLVDNLSLRERVIVTVVIILAVFVFWDFLILSWQNEGIKNKTQAISQEQTQFQIINAEVSRIQAAIKNPSTFMLRTRYQELMKKIAALEYGMQNYKQQVISKREVHRVIHEVLRDIKQVKLLSFKSIDESNDDTSGEAENLSTQVASTLPGFNVNMEKYEIIIYGQYFAVMSYLKLLEKQGWQF